MQYIYDPDGQVLYLGNGTRRTAAALPRSITTVAGTGGGGFNGDGGLATAARFSSNVQGIVVDGQGNLYISDLGNNRIRKVGPDGIITTMAGTGTPGFGGDGGLATNAQLNGPEGIAIDGQGNLFIADRGNNRIRKVSANGIITTVAGNGTLRTRGDGGSATQAQLFSPLDLAVAPDGSFYIAESGVGAAIRKVSPDGTISTAVRSDATTPIMLINPRGLAIDQQGNLFFPNQNGTQVYRLGADGRLAHVAGGGTTLGDGGSATHAQIGALGMAVDRQGNLYITDNTYYRIRKISPDGVITTAAGSYTGTGPGGFSGDGGPAARAQLNQPSDVAVDQVGNLFIADASNARVRAVGTPFPQFAGAIAIAAEDGSEVYSFNSGGRHLRTVNALTGATRYTFAYDTAGEGLDVLPGGCGGGLPTNGSQVCCVSGYVFLDGVPIAGAKVTVTNPNTPPRSVIVVSKDGPDSRFPYYHVDLNSDLHVQPNDQISIHIEYEGRIRDVSHNTLAGGQQVDVVLPRADTPEDYTFQKTLGSQGEGKDLRMPVGVAVDRTGSIYVADYKTFSVQVFNSDGLFLRRWGTRGTKPGQLGPMGGIVLDEQGNVYLAHGNISKFSSTGALLDEWGTRPNFGPDGMFDNATAVGEKLSESGQFLWSGVPAREQGMLRLTAPVCSIVWATRGTAAGCGSARPTARPREPKYACQHLSHAPT